MTSRERQGWWIAASLFLALFLLWGSGFNTAGLFIAPLIKQFGWARTQVSLLVAAMAFASGISSPIAGRLLERVEARGVILTGTLLSGAGSLSRAAQTRSRRCSSHTRSWDSDLDSRPSFPPR